MTFSFRKWKNFINEANIELLIEGRIDDARNRAVKKIKDQPVRDAVLSNFDRVLQNDPSGNQKYAMWAAASVNRAVLRAIRNNQETFQDSGLDLNDEETIANMAKSISYTADNYVSIVTGSLREYHKLAERNLIDNNINNFKDLGDWQNAVYRAERELKQREKMAAIEKDAKAGSEVIGDDEDYMIVRPNTEEGSCYYGQGTKWCISATTSRNYFDQYTGEGKAFYFVLFKHLHPQDPMKKMALVYDGDQGSPDPKEVFDTPDDEVGEDGLREAVRKNIMMKGFARGQKNTKKFLKTFRGEDYIKAEEQFNIYTLESQMDQFLNAVYNDGIETAIKQADLRDIEAAYEQGASAGEIAARKDLAKSMLQVNAVLDGLGLERDDSLYDLFQELENDSYNDITGEAFSHLEDNPAGPQPEDYDKILDKYTPMNHIGVSYDEYDEGRYYWNAYASVDFSAVEGLVDDPDPDALEEAVRSALDDNHIYPDEIEVDTYGGSLEVRISFNPDYDENEGLDGFDSFCSRMADHDGDFDKVEADAIERLKEAGLMGSEATMAVLSDFSDKNYENFEVDLEDNQVTMTTYIPVKIRLPEILMTGDRSDPTQQQMRVYNIMLQTLKDFDANRKNISTPMIQRLQVILNRGFEIAAKQVELTLNEEVEEVGVPIPDYNININFLFPERLGRTGIGRQGTAEYQINDVMRYYLDVKIEDADDPNEIEVVEKFLDVVDKQKVWSGIQKYLEGLVNNFLIKVVYPKIKTPEQSSVEDIEAAYERGASPEEIARMSRNEHNNKKSNLKNLFENWRGYRNLDLYYGTTTNFKDQIINIGIQAPSHWGTYELAESNANKLVEKYGGEIMIVHMKLSEFNNKKLSLLEDNSNSYYYNELLNINIEKKERINL